MAYVMYLLCYLMQKPYFRFLEPLARRPEQRFYMSGVGLREKMRPAIVHRPQGTGDWLIMHFHTPVTIEVEGERNDYPADTLMIWDETDSHHYGNPQAPWEHSWIHCQGSLLPGALEEAGLGRGVYPDLRISLLLENYLPLIHAERLRHDMAPLLFEGLFICLLREIGRVRSPRSSAIPERIHMLRHYLDTHYDQPLRLDDLCQRAAMSKPHLVSEFRKHIGLPPIAYLVRVRLGHARSLLLNRNLSVTEIAARVGYRDIYHFSKLFKKHMGKSPSAFRSK